MTVGASQYAMIPPFQAIANRSDKLIGIISDLSDEGTNWLKALLVSKQKVHCCLVVLLYPACPTREAHLLALKSAQNELNLEDHRIDIRLLPVEMVYNDNVFRSRLPPSSLCLICSQDDTAYINTGSVGDFGKASLEPTSLNICFQPDKLLLDSWMKWFDLIFYGAVPISSETTRIPMLIPARGDPEAARQWHLYKIACEQHKLQEAADGRTPSVDPETGSVKTPKGSPPTATQVASIQALDGTAKTIEELYSKGVLVTIDETSRIKPLDTPVKAKLLGGASTTKIGRVTRTEAYTLRVLDEEAVTAIEKCRKISDLLAFLTYPLSSGNRWLPVDAKELLQKEIDRRNTAGKDILKNAIGGNIDTFVASRNNVIRKDLNDMYRQLGRGDQVPDAQMNEILTDVKSRLHAALDGRIAPQVSYSRISPPIRSDSPSASQWGPPLSLIKAAARLMRRPYTDSFFERNFTKKSFTQNEFMMAMNVLNDVIASDSSKLNRKALAEADEKLISEIEVASASDKDKCKAILLMIQGRSHKEIQSIMAKATTNETQPNE